MSLTLYAAPMSSATPVVHAVAELGVPHELVMLDLSAGDQKQSDYLAINPNGVVPTLVVDGTPLFEAVAIMQWLGETYGVERGLWPAAGTPDRLQALSWTTWAYVTYGGAVQRLNLAQSDRVDPAVRHAPMAEHCRGELDAMLAILDARLAGRHWLLGGEFSLADLIVASVVIYSSYCGVQLDGHANVAAWARRFQQREAFGKTWHQDGQPG
ncbi:glutathione S-transferase family protein [Luteimonas sp. RD2P54]|uniref:Glutathione S-transferase family protein n=1 Tax=Luteimonas endophytica TaxID=3042023 RepID=A0ABT6JD14_9GAMM|nr:glutathione S-transferase family protein [Luteimonas endophytica]MDH5824078.1 glutathione S-transferase family protein [Luteimonas endophytica]